jgi:glycosyltransferase involved in cell wall biosynthesis
MNILFTTPTYYPHKGGAESALRDLTAQFAAAGHRVVVATSKPPGSAPRELLDGVEICRLDYPRGDRGIIGLFVSAWRSLLLLGALFRIIRDEEIEIVCLGLVGPETFLIALLQQLLAFRLVVYLRGGELRHYVKQSGVIRWSLQRCLAACHAAIAVSDTLREESAAFQPLAAQKIFVVPDAIDPAAVRGQAAERRDRPYALFAGRLQPVKGVDRLIEAFGQIARAAPDLDLLIIGTGPLEANLRKLAADLGLGERVCFLGERERGDVFSLIGGCEFVVLPSHAEGCPVIVLEAMAAGKMVIGSRVKGIAELVEHERTGVLFDAGDIGSLSRLMLQYHLSDRLRRQIEQCVRSASLDAYDVCKQYHTHLDIYRAAKATLHVGIISMFYYRDDFCAGPSSYYFNLATSLSDLGHKVFLVTPEGSPHASGTTQVCRTDIRLQDVLPGDAARISLRSFRRILARWIFSRRAFEKIKELDRTFGLDLIVAPELFGQGLFVGLRMRRKLVTRIHTPTYIADRYNERYPFRWPSRVLSLPEKTQVRLSRRITVASAHLASAVAKDWGIRRARLSIIPNSVQVDWVRALAEQQPRKIPEHYLLYFGRLEKRKGVHILSKALPQVFSQHPNIRAVFAGKDCGLRERILRDNRGFEHRLQFLDSLEKEDLFGVVRFADLVVLPSLFENVSNAGLEAMALARPVIGTRGTAFEETIRDGENGFLVEPNDAQALAQKILTCLDRSDLDAIGHAGYCSVLQFDSKTIARQHIECYQAMLSCA